MLPEYTAIAFDKVIEKGGRTKPWTVLVETDRGIKPYVVKMFTPHLVENRDVVTNEVLGNVLAREFDLPVPEAALIHMDENFRMTIHDPRAQMAFDAADERIKFGSALVEGNYLFNPAFTKTQAEKMIDLDTLFAFDVFIRNRDRNAGKPNLLVTGKAAWLIDHELGFEIDQQAIADFKAGQWDEKFYLYHIFLNYLKKSRLATKRDYFGAFTEYLRTLNVNIIQPYLQQLGNHGYDQSRHTMIRDYLREIRQNSPNFDALLKSFIA
jgi:hypothetical protein